jgi:hypothetical protein
VIRPSTGGTAEPNDQPYGDMFFRSYAVPTPSSIPRTTRCRPSGSTSIRGPTPWRGATSSADICRPPRPSESRSSSTSSTTVIRLHGGASSR